VTDRPALSGVPDPVTVRVPGKVNLHLSVGMRRDDGYHDVETVLHAVSLYDEVTATAAGPPGQVTCAVTGEGAESLPVGPDNLAVRAAALFAGRHRPTTGVHLEIAKRLPVGGGMAGGSADAAATLLACDALWRSELPRTELDALAAELGSDVPFLLHGGTALGTGRGEVVTPVLGHGTFHWVLCLADRGLSTADVYAEFDRGNPVPERPVDDVLSAVRQGDPALLARALHNDLQPAALRLRGWLRRVLEAGTDAGAVAGLVSGSGATCAFLTKGPGDAVRVAAALSGAGVCRAVATAHGPVVGARVVSPGGS
jgi:4-diphosphocytidyl-2-C-methyl-D-erythritol kinase